MHKVIIDDVEYKPFEEEKKKCPHKRLRPHQDTTQWAYCQDCGETVAEKKESELDNLLRILWVSKEFDYSIQKQIIDLACKKIDECEIKGTYLHTHTIEKYKLIKKLEEM